MNEPDKNWEAWLHQKLRALPDTRAPKNLAPSVLRKIAARESVAWWRRPWLEWPAAAQIISGVLFAAPFAAAYFWQDSLMQLLRQAAAAEIGRWVFLKAAWTIGVTLAGIAQSLVASIKTSVLMIAGMVALAIYSAVVAVGALFCRVASEQA